MTPMVVWRHHGIDPSEAEIDHMHQMLRAAGEQRFGAEGWNIDPIMRTIPDHFHAHARDPQWHIKVSSRYPSKFTEVGGERVERR